MLEAESYMDGVAAAINAIDAKTEKKAKEKTGEVTGKETRWEILKKMEPEQVAEVINEYGDTYPWCYVCKKQIPDGCDGDCKNGVLKWLTETVANA